MHASLWAAGIGPGDEVLLPSFTFVATANSVMAAGARPVFVDIRKSDFTIDHEDMKKKITRRTKAVIPVHLYGHPCEMDEILEVSSKHSLAVIEDACQSLGSTYKNEQTGTIGEMGCFSLYASKVLTSGEGGAIATNDSKFAENLMMIRNHGMVKGYDTRILGMNLHLPEMCAAIAKVQMKKLGHMLDKRKRNALLMSELLKGSRNFTIPQENEKKKFNWYLYTIAFDKNSTRNSVKEALQDDGIGATIYYDPPVHKTPLYRGKAKLLATEWAAKRVLSLPVHPGVSEAQAARIAASLKVAAG